MNSILHFQKTSFRYPDGTMALHEVEVGFQEGKKTVLLGRNGCGKSTLMQLCNGLLKPTVGQVLFRSCPIDYSRDGLTQLRSKVGFIFQETDCQLFSASVEQDVSFGPFNLGWEETRVVQETEKALQQTGCHSFRGKPTHYLSGGQKKRVAVAGVVAMYPEVILADEPTAHLDPIGCDELRDLFSSLHATGITFVVATHDLHFARHWFDDAIVMLDGAVVASGDAASLLSDQALLRHAGLVSRKG